MEDVRVGDGEVAEEGVYEFVGGGWGTFVIFEELVVHEDGLADGDHGVEGAEVGEGVVGGMIHRRIGGVLLAKMRNAREARGGMDGGVLELPQIGVGGEIGQSVFEGLEGGVGSVGEMDVGLEEEGFADGLESLEEAGTAQPAAEGRWGWPKFRWRAAGVFGHGAQKFRLGARGSWNVGHISFSFWDLRRGRS